MSLNIYFVQILYTDRRYVYYCIPLQLCNTELNINHH